MPGSEFPAIETERLVLRPMEVGDAPAIFTYQSDPEIFRYMSPEPPASVDVVSEGIGKWLALPAEKRRPCWMMVLKGSDRIVGTVSFNQLDPENAAGQLGYEVAREFWGKGLATEAVRAVIDYGFNAMKLNRISAYCWEENRASRRVMEKAGMQYEGTLWEVKYAKGAFQDMRIYALLLSQWRAGPIPCGGRDGAMRGRENGVSR